MDEKTQAPEHPELKGVLFPDQGSNNTGWTLFDFYAVQKKRLNNGHTWKTFPSDGTRGTMYGIQDTFGKEVSSEYPELPKKLAAAMTSSGSKTRVAEEL